MKEVVAALEAERPFAKMGVDPGRAVEGIVTLLLKPPLASVVVSARKVAAPRSSSTLSFGPKQLPWMLTEPPTRAERVDRTMSALQPGLLMRRYRSRFELAPVRVPS